ncbi:uncharacterized short-chain type dehydrogenase/reductase y4vI-like [Antedon mediterranea]|uniref:uncharacterized short-chain type dehydrogenase/reductase y4vI-like n=1 Tax=Antedon mediterranea TaxID=105859 RepID=UPI003AF9C5C3
MAVATPPILLSGKVALITGASSGIGAATSVLFAKLGAKLVLTGRRVEHLEQTGKDCEQHGAKPLIVPGDVTKEADNVALIQKAVEHFGQLDILVNNAGILLSLGTIETTSLQDFDTIMNTNVRSVFHLTSLAVPHLIKTEGNIVNVSSIYGIRSVPGVLAYSISKSAVDQMTHCVALEMAPKKVRVNCVSPGIIVTDIFKKSGFSEEASAAFLEQCKETHALGRVGHVDEVASAIAFLASDSASFITGVTLPVDGGRHAMCGKVAIITGASSGIGAATSVLFAKLGAKLVLSGRPEDNFEETDKNCKQHGAEPLIVPGDVTKEADNVALIEKAVEHFGKLDILINNAGILLLGTIETTSLQDFDHVMNTNARSVFHLTSLAVPHLIKTKGNIVNVSSVNSIRSFPGVLAYGSSKSVIDQVTRCVALEMASNKIRVNSVNPGVIITNIQRTAGFTEEQYAAYLEKSKTTHALGRAGEADEVANAIAFLASDAASFITGVNLPVDGGRHVMCPR